MSGLITTLTGVSSVRNFASVTGSICPIDGLANRSCEEGRATISFQHRCHTYACKMIDSITRLESAQFPRYVLVHLSHHPSNKNPITPSPPPPLPLQRLLLLRVPHQLPPHNDQPLPPPHPIHIPPTDPLPIALLAEILQLLFRLRHPIGILIQQLEPRKYKLRLRGAGCSFSDLVAEAERLGDGKERRDEVEGRAFFEGLGEDAAAAPGEDIVDAAEDFGRGLDFAAVHCEHQSRTPVHKALADCVPHSLNGLARQAALLLTRGRFFVRWSGNSDGFEEDGDALHGFVAHGALGCG